MLGNRIYNVKFGKKKFQISPDVAKDLLDTYRDKLAIEFSKTNFTSCLGIPSSNMTKDFRIIESIINRLQNFPLGWITLKSCRDYEKKRMSSRIYHVKDIISDGVLLRGEYEFLTIQEVIKLSKETRKILNKYYGKDNEVKIILSFFTMSALEKDWNRILIKLDQAEYDVLEIPVKYITKLFKYQFLYPHNMVNDWNTYVNSVYDALNLIHDSIVNVTDKSIIYKFSKDFPFINEVIMKLIKKGKPGFIMFDSDKFYPILPSLDDPIKAIIPETEDGYLKSGSSISGKYLTIDSIKNIYLTSYLLRTIGLKSDIISSGGIQNAANFITRLLCGAKGGEICTATYRSGFKVYWEVLLGLLKFMDVNDFKDVNQVIGFVFNNLTKNENYNDIYVETTEKCTKCSLCYCWNNAFIQEYQNGKLNKFIINTEKCIGCLSCYSTCENFGPGNGLKIKQRI